MIFVEICVGSSCHLKGAPQIVEMMQESIKRSNLEDEIILSGSFCLNKCSRVGVTVTVGDEVFPGITKENFQDLWDNNILPALHTSKGDAR